MDTLTLPFALIVQEYNIGATAGGAINDAIRPAKHSHIGQSIVRVSVENYCLLQGLWLSMFAVHGVNIKRIRLICQVYYCLYFIH